MRFDFYIHGLWILSAIFFLIGGIIAGNIEFVLGTTHASYALSLIIAFLLFLMATMLIVSAAVNAIKEER